MTRPAHPPAVEHNYLTYMSVVRAAYPSLPTTQPLAAPLDLSQAARFVLKDPIYLSRMRGDLWITRPDAPPANQVLRDALDPNAPDPQTHVLRERVVYVHWMPTDAGNWVPYLICRTGPQEYEEIWPAGRKPLPSRPYRWEHAFSWNQDVVVPSSTGVSVLRLGSDIKESYHDLIGDGAAATRPADIGQPRALLDWQGLLAWIPWEKGQLGSRGVARYVEGKWTDLGPQQGWPEKIVHLVPLRDGSVFQFVSMDDGAVVVQSGSLDRPQVNEQAVKDLVVQLDDPDPEVRKKAVTDLANYGPGAWPILEKLLGDQPPQAKLLLNQLLKDKNRPSLSGMTLLGRRSLALVDRLSDGGVVFYAEQGVSIPEADGEATTVAPAWLAIRPGHYVELLPATLVLDLKPTQCHLDVVGDQWIVDSDVRGPRLFYGNGLATLLRKDERQFSRVLGMDQMGRWLFRKSEPGREMGGDPQETLIIDPHLPDPTPRLPVWQLAIAESVGWDKDNWPVIKNGAAYALGESDWRGLDKDEKFFTRPDEIPSAGSTTSPTTAASVERPILLTPDGTRYYGGLTDLKVIEPDGKQTIWPLPPSANGAGPVTLIRARDGRLFLFNQRGRVLRIARTPAGEEPFKLEGTFTHNIPSVSKFTRIWLDPAGRIDIEWANRLAVCFPDGYIPRSILEKMVDQSGLDADN